MIKEEKMFFKNRIAEYLDDETPQASRLTGIIVANNPVNYVDPWGLTGEKKSWSLTLPESIVIFGGGLIMVGSNVPFPPQLSGALIVSGFTLVGVGGVVMTVQEAYKLYHPPKKIVPQKPEIFDPKTFMPPMTYINPPMCPSE